jgi:hypothetical protein
MMWVVMSMLRCTLIQGEINPHHKSRSHRLGRQRRPAGSSFYPPSRLPSKSSGKQRAEEVGEGDVSEDSRAERVTLVGVLQGDKVKAEEQGRVLWVWKIVHRRRRLTVMADFTPSSPFQTHNTRPCSSALGLEGGGRGEIGHHGESPSAVHDAVITRTDYDLQLDHPIQSLHHVPHHRAVVLVCNAASRAVKCPLACTQKTTARWCGT